VTLPIVLSPPFRRAFDRLPEDLARVFGPALAAVVAHGPASSVVFAEAIAADDLDACAALVDVWHRDGLSTPLVLTPDEFKRSLDAFPLEYQAIVDRHVLIAGRDPFAGVTTNPEDLRRACEVQARSHLIHLREGWLSAAGHRDDLAEMIEASAAPLRALLANIARLQGEPSSTVDELTRIAEVSAGMPPDLVRAVLGLETAPEQSHALVGRLREYLEASERLWAAVDAWRSS
jgi:hypothetical protein